LFSFHNLELRSLSGGQRPSSALANVGSLRTLPAQPSRADSLFNEASPARGDFAAKLLLDGFKSDLDRRIYRQLDEGGYLTRISEPDKDVDYYFGRVFDPEVFYFGKKTVSCTLVTAIKRKNPLCLLNPVFFQVTW
jgi:hypothetical protein